MEAPSHWAADVVLADGGTAHLRPIRAEDADGLMDLHRRLSSRTVYLRFFRPYPELTPSDVERFTQVDHDDRVALVCLLNDRLVAVGRYDRLPGTSDAEVAFVVEDAQQGRGFGSALLEHLAAAGRERGIRRFVAEVLPDNRGMLRVFSDAGFTVTRAFDEGVIHLEFPIAPTAASLEVMRAREQHAESRSIARLLAPASVAVIGASRTPGRLGHTVLAHLLAGFAGPVFPVHPEARSVAGVRAFPTVLDVADDIDLAVVCTPGGVVPEVVAQCAEKGVRGLVVISDVPPEAERELVTTARGHGIRVVGPECLGVINLDPAVALNASLASVLPAHGRTGLFSQTGALGVAVLEEVRRRGLGLSTFVSAGRRADVSGNDLLQYWETDPSTSLVLLHLESFGNPRKFARLARRLGRTKPVVAVQGAQSPLVDDLFRQAGVVRVDSVRQMLDVALLLADQPLPAGRTVAVVGDSPPLARLVVDACRRLGLEVVASVDVARTASDDEIAAVVPTVGDSLVVVHAPLTPDPPPGVPRWLAAHADERPVLLVAPSDPTRHPGVPVYAEPQTAVRALSRAVEYAEWRRRPRGAVPDSSADVGSARAALARGDVTALLAAYEIEVVPVVPAATVDEAVAAAAAVGGPVALKTTAEHLRHRVDLGGVRLDLERPDDVRAAYEAMTARLGTSGVVVQRMVPPGVAVVVGAVQDPAFGPLVSFGVAGVATELLGDRAYRIVPLTDLDAADLVSSVRAAPLLTGWRGSAPVDVAALERLLLRVSALAEDLPGLTALSLNPVVVSERGVHVLDATMQTGAAAARPDTGPRRLR